MEEVCVYDNEYYIVELTDEAEVLEENCIQYIAIEGLKGDEVDVDYVEEVIACDNTDQEDSDIVISSVYSTNENVLVENIPDKPDIIDQSFIINDDVNEVIVNEEDDKESSPDLFIEDEPVRALESSASNFETVFVPDFKPLKKEIEVEKKLAKKKAVTKPKTKSTSQVKNATKPKSETAAKTTSTIETKKQVTSASQVSKKRKHKAKKECSHKKLKVDENTDIGKKRQRRISVPQIEAKADVEELKPTRKSARTVTKKVKQDLEDTSPERKKDFRALTRVVFSPKKDKITPASAARRSKEKKVSPKVEIKEEIPRANLREAVNVQKKSSKRYRCQYCSNSYDIASSYYNHVRNTHGKDSAPTSCHLCPSTFKNRDSFLRHLRLYHTGPDAGKTHVCYICKAKYNLKGGLVSHLKHTHNKNDRELFDALKKCVKLEEEEKINNGKKQVKKNIKKINNRFNNKKKERPSIKIEIKAKKHPCYICNSKFTQKSSMYRHIRMNHKNDRVITSKTKTETLNKGKTKGNITIKNIKSVANKSKTIAKSKLGSKTKAVSEVLDNKRTVHCKYCTNIYSSRQSLSNHVQIKHKEEKRNIKKNSVKNYQSNIKIESGMGEVTYNFIANFK